MQSLAAVTIVPSYEDGLAFFRDSLGFAVVEDTPQGPDRRWLVVAPEGGAGARIWGWADYCGSKSLFVFPFSVLDLSVLVCFSSRLVSSAMAVLSSTTSGQSRWAAASIRRPFFSRSGFVRCLVATERKRNSQVIIGASVRSNVEAGAFFVASP
jgi:hypothetical protein